MGNTEAKNLVTDNVVADNSDTIRRKNEALDRPSARVIFVTENDETLKEGLSSLPSSPATIATAAETTDGASLVSSISDPSLTALVSVTSSPSSGLGVKAWDGKTYYADFIQQGLEKLRRMGKNRPGMDGSSKVLMLYESPSSSSTDTSFYNSQVFNYHDFPSFPSYYKSVLAPCRYSVMNGGTYPSYLKDGVAPAGLIEHWKSALPAGYEAPTFCKTIDPDMKVYAYLPVEHLDLMSHVHDPHVHYHLAGKDALHLMSPERTTRLLSNTRDERPCVAKVTHAMGSKGIFVIRNDEDEKEFLDFLKESGNPTFVVTEFVDIARNVACHFFIHPDSNEITWFGSNENVKMADGDFSTDSTIIMAEQEELKRIQLPFVKDVVQYCKSLGFWGFCGIDVLFDASGKGYVVDVNPRVTGTCPALMIASLLQKEYGFDYGLFRRNSSFMYAGSAEQLLEQTSRHNAENEGKSRIVLHSFYEKTPDMTLVNIAVYGHSLEDCQKVLDHFAPEMPDGVEA